MVYLYSFSASALNGTLVVKITSHVLFIVLYIVCVDCVVLRIVCVYMCTVLLPPGVNPIAVNRYININNCFTPKKESGHPSSTRDWVVSRAGLDRCTEKKIPCPHWGLKPKPSSPY
jgi:hypothetical protein